MFEHCSRGKPWMIAHPSMDGSSLNRSSSAGFVRLTKTIRACYI